MAAAVFQLHRKARRRAHAVDRRRVHGDDRSLRNLIAHAHDLADQGVDGQGFIFTFIPVTHADEGRSPIRFRPIGQDTETDNVHDTGHARLLFQPFADLFTDLFRFRLGNAFGQGDVHHDEGIIFRRDKACRHDFEDACREGADDDQEGHAPFEVKLQVSQAQAIPGDEPIEGIIEFLEELVNALGVVIGFVDIQNRRTHGRCQGQSDEGRNEDRHGNGQGELAVEDTAHAADEADGDEDGGQDAGNTDNRVLYVFHSDNRRLPRTSGIVLDFVFNGFDDDDGIVDEEADSQDHGEQGQRINGEIEDLEAGKGTQQRYRDGDERDQRRPAALEEDINDEGDQQQGFDEGYNNFMNRRRNEGRAIVDDFIIHISRESLLSLFQDFAGAADGLHGIGVCCQADHETGSLAAVEVTGNGIILGSQADIGNVADADHGTVGIGADDDVLELFRRLQAAVGTQGILVGLVVRRRLGADGADSGLFILSADSRDDIGRCNLQDIHLHRVEPDAHGIVRPEFLDVADARDGFQFIHEVLGSIVLHERRIIRAIGGNQGDDHSHGTRRLLDCNAGLGNF